MWLFVVVVVFLFGLAFLEDLRSRRARRQPATLPRRR